MSIETLAEQNFPSKYKDLFLGFYREYKEAVRKSGQETAFCEPLFLTLLEKAKEQLTNPYPFEPYHKQITEPFDYYELGLDFLRPLIDFSRSSFVGENLLEEIQEKLSKKENVVFLSNHQIEADPQVISLLMEKKAKQLAKEMIFVAGERVILDPVAAPMSLGRNLLCIFSKRHIDNPPERKMEKQLHNKKTMEKMSELLSEGGHAIWVAPSGGRDRPDPKTGQVFVAPFDPSSLEMFYLMAQKASRPTSFYPMALSTYPVLPPPNTVEKDLGEARAVHYSPVHLWIGPAIAMESCPGVEASDKRTKREHRAKFITSLVEQAYAKFP